MADEGKQDRRGTFWDWPVGVAFAGLLLAVFAASNNASGGIVFGLLLAAFGAVALLARRGAFSPRRD